MNDSLVTSLTALGIVLAPALLKFAEVSPEEVDAEVSHEHQSPAQRRGRLVATRTSRRAHRRDRRGPLCPKFDGNVEISDPIRALLSIDETRSTTGTTIGVGSPSPFLCWPAPCRCSASMPGGATRPGADLSKKPGMGIAPPAPDRHQLT